MPQMFPINWIVLMLLTIIMFFSLMNKMFFQLLVNNFETYSMKKEKISFNYFKNLPYQWMW